MNDSCHAIHSVGDDASVKADVIIAIAAFPERQMLNATTHMPFH